MYTQQTCSRRPMMLRAQLLGVQPQARPIKAAQSAGGVKVWRGTLLSTAPLLGDTSQGITYQVIDKTGLASAPASMDNWELKPRTQNDFKQGWIKFGDITVPAEISEPAVIKLRKASSDADGSLDYISELLVDLGKSQVTFPIHSWVASQHDDRVFFAPTAYLPSETPDALRSLREQELKELRGDGNPAINDKRQGADRIYEYQTYDDLGSATQYRPPLGDSAVRPYPRRIATNRKRDARGQEVNVSEDPDAGNPTKSPWLPYDERFDFSKAQGFKGNTLMSGIPALVQGLKKTPPLKMGAAIAYQQLLKMPGLGDKLPHADFPPVENFEDVRDVLELYGQDIASKGISVESLQPTRLYPLDAVRNIGAAVKRNVQRRFNKRADGSWDLQVDAETAKAAKESTIAAEAGQAVMASAKGASAVPAAAGTASDEAPPAPTLKDVLKFVKGEVRAEAADGNLVQDLLRYPLPRSLEGRPDEWHEDIEMGRQSLAGMHPCVLTALTQHPEALGSAIRNEHMAPDLQGSSLEKLVASAAAGEKPRLFLIDYWALSHFWPQMADGTNMVQHAGRAIFYLRRRVGPDGELTQEDEALVPVAIELARKDNARGKAGVVYSHHELVATPETEVIWRLAKAVFRSLDTAYHQLNSHWMRTHACLEPFLIAMRRQMSVMHPVFKLMLPHFRYTLNINANARSSLINAGGIIEDNFSAGEFALRLSSVVYSGWRFRTQALPEDLKARGMVNPTTGKPWMEYPYAQDGMDIWAAYEEYFGAFLAHHYQGDGAVAADVELQAWWTEVKTVGHVDLVKYGLATEADIWGFEGPITTQAQLVRILVTIAWTASAHHAAVNFGQYDFAGLILNCSSMIRRPMPVRGDKAWQELVKAPAGQQQERVFLSYLSHLVAAAAVMTTVKLLSGHAEGEHTLEQPNDYLKDPVDVKLNQEFIKKVLALETQFIARNNDPSSWTRAATQVNPKTMPYTLLLPSSPAGVTSRGVPYSVSI